MKLGLFAIAAIATTALLIPISLTDSAGAQNCVGEEGISICLSDNWQRDNSQRNNRQPDDPSEYDKINTIYRQVLGRDADFQGLRTWSRELQRGRSLRNIRHELAKSREAQDAINQIYWEVLGRNVGVEALQTWTKQLARGRTLAQVRQAIEGSTEGITGGYWR